MRISDWSSDVCSSDLLASDGSARAHRLTRSSLDIEAALQRSFRQGGDDIDDAANGLAAPENRLWATQHFDTRHIPDEQLGEVIGTPGSGGIGSFYTVDPTHGLTAFPRPQSLRMPTSRNRDAKDERAK